MKWHVAIRVSPKGEDFLGKCLMCGKENLSMYDVNADCNGNLMTYEEAIKIVMANPHGPNKITIIRKIR